MNSEVVEPKDLPPVLLPPMELWTLILCVPAWFEKRVRFPFFPYQNQKPQTNFYSHFTLRTILLSGRLWLYSNIALIGRSKMSSWISAQTEALHWKKLHLRTETYVLDYSCSISVCELQYLLKETSFTLLKAISANITHLDTGTLVTFLLESRGWCCAPLAVYVVVSLGMKSRWCEPCLFRA